MADDIIVQKLNGYYGDILTFTNDVKVIMAKMKDRPISMSDGSESEAPMKDIEKAAKLCKLIQDIREWTRLITELGIMVEKLNEIMSFCAQYPMYFASQIIMQKTQILALYIKKGTIYAKIEMAKGKRKIIEKSMSGSGPQEAAVILAPVIAAFQAMAAVLLPVLLVVQALLESMPPPMSVMAEGMCLFMTPKSLMKQDMKALNPNQSILDRVPEGIKKTIHGILTGVDVSNTQLKIAGIIAMAALGAAAATSAADDFELGDCPKLAFLDPAKILKMIETLVMAIVTPQALPKYEKVTIANPGYLVWLMTAFVPAGKKSFGIPGMP